MSNLNDKFLKLQIGARERLSVYRKLSKYLSNGVSLTAALDNLYTIASEEGKKPKKPVAVMLSSWRKSIAEGRDFGAAIKGWVPDRDLVILMSGNRAGKLQMALENAIFIQQSGKKIRSAILGGIAYPLLLSGVVIAFMYVVSTQVVPAFDAVKPQETWVGLGASLAFVANLVESYAVPAGIGVVLLLMAIFFSLPRWTGRLRVKFDRFPPFSLYRLTVGSGFMLSLSAMVESGVPINKALMILRRDANPWYRERLDGALRFLNSGKNFGEALHLSRHEFPDRESVADLRAYSTLDGFDETLKTMGREWLDDSVEKVTQQASIMRIVSLLVLGLTFIWIAVSIFSLNTQISTGL